MGAEQHERSVPTWVEEGKKYNTNAHSPMLGKSERSAGGSPDPRMRMTWFGKGNVGVVVDIY